MTDLSRWDFAENFSGYDAAALILGLEPWECDDEEWRMRVVTDRMELNYKNAIERLSAEAFDYPDWAEWHDRKTLPIELLSVEASVQYSRLSFRHGVYQLNNWIDDKRSSKFENQKFSRHTIVRWLADIGLKSVYAFNRDQAEAVSKQVFRWPWGDHHTEALGHLEAAARRFWSANYDPADSSTAETNKKVSAWLQKERKVSKTMADSIASILRVDGLPTGPRK